MKTAKELSELSDKFIGKLTDDLIENQNNIINNALENPSDYDLLTRTIRIHYLLPQVEGRNVPIKKLDDTSAYIDLRNNISGDEIKKLKKNAEDNLISLGYKISNSLTEDCSGGIMTISWQ